VPTWTLVPAGGEWRWQASGDRCLWHQSMRLFRQPALDDWTSVFASLDRAIADFIETSHRPPRELAA
jgi:hypothetical protein